MCVSGTRPTARSPTCTAWRCGSVSRSCVTGWPNTPLGWRSRARSGQSKARACSPRSVSDRGCGAPSEETAGCSQSLRARLETQLLLASIDYSCLTVRCLYSVKVMLYQKTQQSAFRQKLRCTCIILCTNRKKCRAKTTGGWDTCNVNIFGIIRDY